MTLTLVVLFAGVNASAGSTTPMRAYGQQVAPAVAKCKLMPAKLTLAQVALPGGFCLVNKRRISLRVTSYSYQESDYYGFTCGDAVGGTGSSFSLKYPQAYGVSIAYTATSTAKVNGKLIRRTGKSNLSTNSRSMACGKRTTTTVVPDRHAVCKYIYNASLVDNNCGVPRPAVPGLVPISTAMPYLDIGTNTVSVPPFMTPSGLCMQTPESDAVVSWWGGKQTRPIKWNCPDGTSVVPIWYIYLTPTDHPGDGNHPGPSCRAGSFNQPGAPNTGALPFGGVFTQFAIPPEWSGRIDVEVNLIWMNQAGDEFLSDEYVDNVFMQPKGTVNGCQALTSYRG